MKKIFTIFILVCSAMYAQASETDLIGTYAVKDKKGVMQEYVKVSQDAGKFYIFIKRDGTWLQDKEPLTTFSRDQFEKLLKHPYAEPFDSLAKKGVAVFKVPKNFQEGKFKAESGYFMFFGMRLIELHKL